MTTIGPGTDLARMLAAASEGFCPRGHGRLTIRPHPLTALTAGSLQPVATGGYGWCEPCRLGYRVHGSELWGIQPVTVTDDTRGGPRRPRVGWIGWRITR